VKRHAQAVAGLIGAGFLGGLLAMSIAADAPKQPPISPRYSFQVPGPGGFLVLDNQTNILHVYVEQGGKLSLKATQDLNETGKDTMQIVVKK